MANKEVITRWDPRPKVDQVNMSNKFQVFEGQKEKGTPPKTDTTIWQTSEQVPQDKQNKINTKKWVEEKFRQEVGGQKYMN